MKSSKAKNKEDLVLFEFKKKEKEIKIIAAFKSNNSTNNLELKISNKNEYEKNNFARTIENCNKWRTINKDQATQMNNKQIYSINNFFESEFKIPSNTKLNKIVDSEEIDISSNRILNKNYHITNLNSNRSEFSRDENYYIQPKKRFIILNNKKKKNDTFNFNNKKDELRSNRVNNLHLRLEDFSLSENMKINLLKLGEFQEFLNSFKKSNNKYFDHINEKVPFIGFNNRISSETFKREEENSKRKNLSIFKNEHIRFLNNENISFNH